MSALVLGHMNPDTDSIVSAIVAAEVEPEVIVGWWFVLGCWERGERIADL